MNNGPNAIRHRLDCECGCGSGIEVAFWHTYIKGDEDVAISTTCSCSYSKQDGIWATICKRVKAAWFMLMGKEYLLHDILIERVTWVQFLKDSLVELGGADV